MHQMIDIQLVKLRRDELLGEAELNRQAKALRAAGKGRAGRRSALVWEMNRYAGLLLKHLRLMRNAG